MVHIDLVAYCNSFRAEAVDWALANVGDKVRIELTFTVKTYTLASSEQPVRVNCVDGFIGAGWIVDESGAGRFKDFRIGDSYRYYDRNTGDTQTGTIVDKQDNNTIQLSAVIGFGVGNDYTVTNHLFTVTTPITAIRYKWNFIENAESPNFISKISGTEQRLITQSKLASDTTPSAMTFLGEKSYQTGNATIEGVSIDTGSSSGVYASKYKIIHYTTITPFMLSAQWDDLEAGIQPPYFFNSKCLKNVYNIEAAKLYTDPNWMVMVEQDDVIGNTGGYGENFNNGITNYYIDSVVFQNATGDVLDAIELTDDETTVTIVVKNTVDAPFSNNNTKFELQMLKAPYDESEYQVNGRTVDENFIDDRALQTVGSASINGTQYGVAGRQCLKTVVGTYNSTSQITITCKIDMLASTMAIMAESEEPRYILNVAVQKHSLATSLSDLVRLPVSIAPFFIDNSDPTMIDIDTFFLRHPEEDPDTEGSPDLVVAPEDEVVAYSKFYIENDTRETDEILIKSVTCKVKAKNSVTDEEFDLDTFTLPFATQTLNFSQDRVFHIPTTEIRKPIVIQRRVDLDVAERTYYTALFPFKVRWEEWVKCIGANTEFFDVSEPQDGLNQNWHRYSLGTNWGLYYEIKINTTKNGLPLIFTDELQFTSYDYLAGEDDWRFSSIKSYDGSTELLSGGNKYIMGYKDTKIVASFSRRDEVPVDLSLAVVNVLIEVFEQGGVEGQRRMSSAWVSASDTWFKSIDTSNKGVLTVGADDWTIDCTLNVDYLLIPDAAKFSITARLYYLDVPPYTAYKEFEDAAPFEFEEGDPYEFED